MPDAYCSALLYHSSQPSPSPNVSSPDSMNRLNSEPSPVNSSYSSSSSIWTRGAFLVCRAVSQQRSTTTSLTYEVVRRRGPVDLAGSVEQVRLEVVRRRGLGDEVSRRGLDGVDLAEHRVGEEGVLGREGLRTVSAA